MSSEHTYTFKPPSEPVFTLMEMKPNYNITFHRDGKQVGVLDFNGPEMTFVGDADESAKVFFDFIAGWFKGRLDQERADERKKVRAAMKKAHVRLLKNAIAAERKSWPSEMEAMERQVNILTDALAAEREVCSKLCEEIGEESDSFTRDILRSTAAAIRARSNT